MCLQRESNPTERHHDEADQVMCLGFKQTCSCIPVLSLTKPTDLNFPILSFPEHKIRLILSRASDVRIDDNVGKCLAENLAFNRCSINGSYYCSKGLWLMCPSAKITKGLRQSRVCFIFLYL